MKIKGKSYATFAVDEDGVIYGFVTIRNCHSTFFSKTEAYVFNGRMWRQKELDAWFSRFCKMVNTIGTSNHSETFLIKRVFLYRVGSQNGISFSLKGRKSAPLYYDRENVSFTVLESSISASSK